MVLWEMQREVRTPRADWNCLSGSGRRRIPAIPRRDIQDHLHEQHVVTNRGRNGTRSRRRIPATIRLRSHDPRRTSATGRRARSRSPARSTHNHFASGYVTSHRDRGRIPAEPEARRLGHGRERGGRLERRRRNRGELGRGRIPANTNKPGTPAVRTTTRSSIVAFETRVPQDILRPKTTQPGQGSHDQRMSEPRNQGRRIPTNGKRPIRGR